jgi:hypothetical protein
MKIVSVLPLTEAQILVSFIHLKPMLDIFLRGFSLSAALNTV